MELKKQNNIELFETMPIPQAVAQLSIPSIIACLVLVLYNLVDTFFVGELHDPIQTAGVTFAAPVLLAFNAITNLFGTGTSSKMSRALGEKQYDTVRRTSSFGFYCALACSILFALLATIFKDPLMNLLGVTEETREATSDYLFWCVTCGTIPAIMNIVVGFMIRAEGLALQASIGTVSGCLLNIILDPIFILPWGLGMGAAGAGLATFIGNSAACLYFAVFLLKKRGQTYVSVNPKLFSFRGDIAKDVCAVGVPASIQNLLNVTGMTVLNNFVAAYDASAIAAMGISHKISMIPLYVSMGITQGVMPLISYNYASRNIKRMKNGLGFTAAISMALIIFFSGLMAIFAPFITRVFLNEPSVVAYGSVFLRYMAIGIPFLTLDFLGVAVFQACGMGFTSLVFAIMRKIVLEIPALFILNIIYPLYGLALAQACAEVILSTAAVIVLIRLIHRLEKELR